MLIGGFFDYKDYIKYEPGSDLFGIGHIIFMVLALISVIVLTYVFRKTSKDTMTRFLKVLSVVIIILEIIKIVWESYWDLHQGKNFNWDGLLPLYTCSLFMFVLPFAAWGKGKVRRCSLAFLTTIGILGGLVNFFLPPILNYYPFFAYATFVSLNYHYLMVLTGLLILSTGYYIPKWKDALYGFIIIVIFSIIVIPVNFILKHLGYYPDYMLYMYGNGAPILPMISDFFIKRDLHILYSFVIMFGYLGVSYIFIAFYNLILKVTNKIISKKDLS